MGGAELVGGEQVHDRGHVPLFGQSHDGHRRTQVNRCQFRHAPSLPDRGQGSGGAGRRDLLMVLDEAAASQGQASACSIICLNTKLVQHRHAGLIVSR